MGWRRHPTGAPRAPPGAAPPHVGHRGDTAAAAMARRARRPRKDPAGGHARPAAPRHRARRAPRTREPPPSARPRPRAPRPRRRGGGCRRGWGGGGAAPAAEREVGWSRPLVGYLRSNPNRFLTHGRPGSPTVARRLVGAVDATPPPDRHPRRPPPRVAPTIPPCAWERRHPVCSCPSPSPLHPHPRPPPLPSWCLFAAMLASRW